MADAGRGTNVEAAGAAAAGLDRRPARRPNARGAFALRAHLPPRALPASPFAKLASALTLAIGAASKRIRLFASHDFALARACAEPQCAQVDLHNAGSEEAVRALVSGSADLAGFHTSAMAQSDGAQWLIRVREKPNLWIEPLMEREQGLLVTRRNPLKLRGLSDLARPGVRFVNRQRGSGTRALLDMLLQNEGVRPSSINGYAREEFTHEAVAAMIAAGAADAGLGLQAAAVQFNLAFIPLGRETYFLAGKQTLHGQSDVLRLINATKAHAAQLPGYRAL